MFKRLIAGALALAMACAPALAADKTPLANYGGGAISIKAGDTVPCAVLPAQTGDVTKSAGSCSTTLATSGVTAGSYTCTSATFDAKGRATAASNGTCGASAANPTATASDTAVNGSASTYMRSDAAPPVQKGSSSAFGIVKVDGTTITASGGVISAVPGSSGSLVLISEVVTAASQSTVSFTSIPATYRDLFLVVRGRTSESATASDVLAVINSDTTPAHYPAQILFFNSTGTGALAATANTAGLYIGQLAGASAVSGYGGLIQVRIGDYRGTTFTKSANIQSAPLIATTNELVGGRSVWSAWTSTAAITRIDVTPLTGAVTFVNNTVVSLYGSF